MSDLEKFKDLVEWLNEMLFAIPPRTYGPFTDRRLRDHRGRYRKQ
tara:strand:- start:1194 stop:1328 length:135 start_codon:yes stop_codon:yes gene_type:complete